MWALTIFLLLYVKPHRSFLAPIFTSVFFNDAIIQQALHCKNALHLWNSPAFCDLLASCDQFITQRFLTPDVHQEVNFLILVLSNPDTYRWESPIAHFIPCEHDYNIFQDGACQHGTGGFYASLDFWWTLPWSDMPYQLTLLPPPLMDPLLYISSNLIHPGIEELFKLRLKRVAKKLYCGPVVSLVIFIKPVLEVFVLSLFILKK